MTKIDPHRWKELSPYLDEALALQESERVAWLESVRRRNPELGDLLQTLLEEHFSLAREHFLEVSPPMPGFDAPRSGQTIGSYTLLSPIGHGGMGSVWLGERSDGRFQRRVAIKFLNFALVGNAGEQRFRREGKILARLSHPHIAQLVDAGVTSGGQPYLVLEHVDGEQIDKYCERNALDLPARVRLFLDVLSAVAHAHVSLIVHRDLKPSNVLVNPSGQVKLLDFGIAKLLDDEAQPGAKSLLTRDAGSALTPLFAAPEQLTGRPITTATDVYTAGVLLYLLLTGRYPTGSGARSPAQLIKAITETEPSRPSIAVTSGFSGQDPVSTQTQKPYAPADKLRRQLRGDLDNILLKALKKNPAERYPSAGAFAEDLTRYLRHEPIHARPDTLAYRTAKFVRRHRVGVSLGTLTLAAVLAGSAGTLLQYRTASRERDFAFRQLARAEAINDLNTYVLSNAAPSGKPFTVDQLLSGAEKIVQRQQGDPSTRVELMISIGRQYTVQDEYQKAGRLLEEAYKLSRSVSDHSIRASASCGLAQALSRTGDPQRAETLFLQGLAELPKERLYIVDRVSCLLRGSEVAANSARPLDAVARAKAAADLIRQSPLQSDALDLDVRITLAGAYGDAGLRGMANQAYQEAAARLQALGRDDTQMAGTLFNNWGSMLLRAGRPLDAERALRRTLEISRDGPGEETVPPTTLGNYAYVLYMLDRLDEAARYAELAYHKSKLSGDSTAAGQSLLHLARIWRAQGKLALSDNALAELLPQLHKTLPPNHIAFAVLASEQSLNAQAGGDLKNAMRLADQAVKISDALAAAGRRTPDYQALFLVRRSDIEHLLHRDDLALADASSGLDLLKKVSIPGESSASVARADFALGNALQGQGKGQDARVAFLDAARQFQDTLGPTHPDTLAARRLAGLPAN